NPRRRLPGGSSAVPLRDPRRGGRPDGRAGRRHRHVRRRGRERDHTADRARGRAGDGWSAMSRNVQSWPDFERRAADLDGLAAVPTEFLLDLVEEGGTCWWE